MSVSGLTSSPLRCCLRLPDRNQGLVCRQVSAIPSAGKPNEKNGLLHDESSIWTVSIRKWKTQKTLLIKFAVDASYGDMASESAGRLLKTKFKLHRTSLLVNMEAQNAIEAVHDKIIMQKFYERKNPKIDIRKRSGKSKQSRAVQTVTSRFQTPATKFIVKTSIAFIILGVLIVLFPRRPNHPSSYFTDSLPSTSYMIG